MACLFAVRTAGSLLSSWLPAVARDCADLAPVERFFCRYRPFVLVEVMNMYTPKNSPFSRKWMVGRCSFPFWVSAHS